ncbi:hypothetical protein Misp05_35350 [Micromonospora sp. NBRC 107095]|nr:hypothetical protein Misp05_35350 [Micromonospora sp. NBRC 107095]
MLTDELPDRRLRIGECRGETERHAPTLAVDANRTQALPIQRPTPPGPPDPVAGVTRALPPGWRRLIRTEPTGWRTAPRRAEATAAAHCAPGRWLTVRRGSGRKGVVPPG